MQDLTGIAQILKDTGVSDVAKDLIGYVVGDRLAVKRAENLSKIITNANLDSNGLALLSDKYKVNFVNHASLEDDEYMQKLWSSLLYNSVVKKDSNVTFINILKELDVVSAKIFNKIYSTNVEKMPELIPSDFYSFGCDNNNIASKFDNLGRLMLVRIDNPITVNGIKPNMPHAMQLIKESNKYYLKTDLGVAMYNHLNRLPIK